MDLGDEAESKSMRMTDARVRLLVAPAVGIAIAAATGVYRETPWGGPAFWAISAWFVLISFLVWEGNRVIWISLRGRSDWIGQPIPRLSLLATVSLIYSVVVFAGMLLLWGMLSGNPPLDSKMIEAGTLANVVSVIFIAHSYETLHLVRQRRRYRLERQCLEQARARAELAALNAQIDSHFVFNSLNTIVELNEEDPALATEFALTLSEVYRYVVLHGGRDLVPLSEEFEFLEKYASLLRTRFGNGIRLRVPAPAPHHRDLRIPPISLQILLENAVKHTSFGDDRPLHVSVELKGRKVVVWNGKRPLMRPAPGARTGLTNLDQRCKLICGPGIEIQESAEVFSVVVPLL